MGYTCFPASGVNILWLIRWFLHVWISLFFFNGHRGILAQCSLYGAVQEAPFLLCPDCGTGENTSSSLISAGCWLSTLSAREGDRRGTAGSYASQAHSGAAGGGCCCTALQVTTAQIPWENYLFSFLPLCTSHSPTLGEIRVTAGTDVEPAGFLRDKIIENLLPWAHGHQR